MNRSPRRVKIWLGFGTWSISRWTTSTHCSENFRLFRATDGWKLLPHQPYLRPVATTKLSKSRTEARLMLKQVWLAPLGQPKLKKLPKREKKLAGKWWKTGNEWWRLRKPKIGVTIYTRHFWILFRHLRFFPPIVITEKPETNGDVEAMQPQKNVDGEVIV